MATKKAATTKKPSTSKKTVSTKTAKVTKPVQKTEVKAAKVAIPTVGETVRNAAFWRSLSAEFLGTFLLAAVVIVGQGQPLYTLFAVIAIVLFFGAVSGAHINPAISIAAWVTRRISWIRATGYVVAQVVGALVALVTLTYFAGGAGEAATAALGGSGDVLFKAAALAQDKELYVFFSELLGTAILGFAVANALRAGQSRLTSAFTVGGGIFVALMIAFIASSYVGASAIINPAVAFSLKAISWETWPIAVYILAPIVGGVLGFVINDLIKGRATK